jgi:hypothetical protein
VLALVASGFFTIAPGWRAVIWAVALTTMGSACITNAFRCGRVHCFATGPFLLLMAVVALLYGFALLPLGKAGWNVIGVTVLIGTFVLTWLPERFFGKYRYGGQ